MVRIELDRTVDRALRDAIDELTRQLTPLGKIELATRLFGEVATETVDAILAVLTTPPATRVAIAPAHEEPVRVAIERGGGEREEARKPSPASSNVEAVSDDAATTHVHEEDTHDE